ncbi:MAG: hypothetical protein K9J85_00665 [Desulfobacteraceae bacterium]|nr:hypothetical protein [Desulfobacteraceae bacterium]
MKRVIFFILIAALVAGPFGTSAFAGTAGVDSGRPDGAAMAVDIVVARPVGLVSTILGSAVFVVSLPFSALGKNVNQSYDLLVVSPARYTFDRPLGDFD